MTTDSNHKNPVASNRLDRRFDVAAPNRVWTTDITYVWTFEGWLYLAVDGPVLAPDRRLGDGCALEGATVIDALAMAY